ncbi:ExeA family protein [Thiomicrorhabdus cannonii]|uniref:ExeA family protein n=1 Tax=Thiomicrorhabdus cannonii TaxID=2748011 RepID=UPI0015C14518|nr:AAA family ATPase [Thiomicrorhabdus cannonii]
MYRGYFGLTQLPFKNTPNVHFFYEQASRKDILNALTYVIQRGDPIVKVTGEVGCGKTTLLRLLADSLDERFTLVYINSPNLTPKDLLFHIADELCLSFDADLPKFHLLKSLRHQLVSLHASGKHVVMLVDEAQAMSFDTLEEVRLLSNLETNTDKLIQIVLFGQPELDQALEKHQLRQLKDRISYNIHVPPLTQQEVQAYLNYRMRQASFKDLDFFDAKFSKLIHKLSGGLPRSINTIADQLLMAVFGSGDRKLKTKHFKNLSKENLKEARSSYLPYLISLAIVLFLFLLILTRFDQGINQLFERTVGGVVHEVNRGSSVDTMDDASHKTVAANEPAAVEHTEKLSEIKKATINEETSVADATPSMVLFIQASSSNINLELAGELAVRHEAAVQWLNGLNESSYVVQMATFDLDDYLKAKAFYTRYKMITDSLYVVLDLNSNTQKFRIKFLYVGSDSYSQLLQKINELPTPLKASQPFITPVHLLLQTVRDTEKNLENWEKS